MDRFDAMKAFMAVAEQGSFTQAAEKLNLSNQLVSKYVSQFEDYLQVRLFNRTTRSVRLTEAGEQCFQHVSFILEGVQNMEGHFGQMQTEVQGKLRISAPVSFATMHFSALINDFKKQYPTVGIDLQLNDRKVDVIEEGFDVVIRIGHLKSSSLYSKKLAPIRLVLCASPDYVKQHGTPTHPHDLNPNHFLKYSYMEYNPSDSALMKALKLSTQNQQYGMVANNGEVLMDAAIAGSGYVLQPTFIVSKALKQGKLITLLDAYEPEPLGLYAVYPHRKLLATKFRVFIDFISDYYGPIPYWDL